MKKISLCVFASLLLHFGAFAYPAVLFNPTNGAIITPTNLAVTPPAFQSSISSATYKIYETNDYYTAGFNPSTYNGHWTWLPGPATYTNAGNGVILFYDPVNTMWAMNPATNYAFNVAFFDNNATTTFTNAAWTAANGVTPGVGYFGTNSVATSGWLTNYEVPNGTVIVCPYTDLPAYFTNSPFYFGPWLGSNYVQQAVNTCAQLTNGFYGVGGGRVIVVGVNYAPNPITFTNAFDSQNLVGQSITSLNWPSVLSYDLEAPSFTAGAIVCATNPCVRAGGLTGTTAATVIYLKCENLIIASLQNQPTNLVEILPGVERLDFIRDYFGPWSALTNNAGFGGLVTPAIGAVGKKNLVLKIMNNNVDMYNVRDCSFHCIQSVFFNPDHGNFDGNLFNACGGIGGNTDWTSNSIYSAGACIVIGTGNPHNDRLFYHNYFAQTYAAYITADATGAEVSCGDQFEGATVDVIRVNGGYLSQTFTPPGAAINVPSYIGIVTNVDCFTDPDKTPAGFALGASANTVAIALTSAGFSLASGTYAGNAGTTLTNNSGALIAGVTASNSFIASPGALSPVAGPALTTNPVTGAIVPTYNAGALTNIYGITLAGTTATTNQPGMTGTTCYVTNITKLSFQIFLQFTGGTATTPTNLFSVTFGSVMPYLVSPVITPFNGLAASQANSFKLTTTNLTTSGFNIWCAGGAPSSGSAFYYLVVIPY